MDAGGSQHGACPVRVVNIYATPWRFNGTLGDDECTPTNLNGLEQHYKLYKDQLPRLLPARVLGERIQSGAVTLAQEVRGVTVANAKAELFMLPSKQVVLAVTMCLADGVLTDGRGVEPIVEVLEQCIVGDIKIGEHMVADALSADFAGLPAFSKEPELHSKTAQSSIRAGRRIKGLFKKSTDFVPAIKDTSSESLLPERHQLVFARPTGKQPVPNQRVIEKVLYRSAPPYRPEFIDPRLPKQLNSHLKRPSDGGRWTALLMNLVGHHRTDETLGVVTPYVSLLYGHQEYVEASILLSTVHAVGAAARFRHIWREAYQQALQFREQKQKADTGEQTRDDLELLADSLGNLEFDLTFSVEFPLLRIETFQSDLYDAMDLVNQAATLSQMFNQLGGSLKSEITAIEVREGRRTKNRQRWNSFAAGVLSLIGVPVGFVIAFLGINTTEVPQDPKVSMWASQYAVVYLIASSFALTPVFLIAFPYLREFALSRRYRRPLGWGTAAAIVGVVVFVWALMSDRHQTGSSRVADAIATASGAFLTLVGLTLIVPLVWRYAVHGHDGMSGRRLDKHQPDPEDDDLDAALTVGARTVGNRPNQPISTDRR